MWWYICMIYGIRGMAALNAARAVITAICIFWTRRMEMTVLRYIRLKMAFDIPFKRAEGGGYKIKAAR